MFDKFKEKFNEKMAKLKINKKDVALDNVPSENPPQKIMFDENEDLQGVAGVNPAAINPDDHIAQAQQLDAQALKLAEDEQLLREQAAAGKRAEQQLAADQAAFQDEVHRQVGSIDVGRQARILANQQQVQATSGYAQQVPQQAPQAPQVPEMPQYPPEIQQYAQTPQVPPAPPPQSQSMPPPQQAPPQQQQPEEVQYMGLRLMYIGGTHRDVRIPATQEGVDFIQDNVHAMNNFDVFDVHIIGCHVVDIQRLE